MLVVYHVLFIQVSMCRPQNQDSPGSSSLSQTSNPSNEPLTGSVYPGNNSVASVDSFDPSIPPNLVDVGADMVASNRSWNNLSLRYRS